MEKQELKRTMKDLLESSKTPNHEDTVALLKRLRKEVVVSEELLKDTKAGLGVGKLRTHQDPGVSDAAKELVKKWKSEVETLKKAAIAQAAAKKGTPAKHSIQTKVANVKSPAPSSPQTPATPTKYRSAKDDGISIPTVGDKTRDKCIEMIYDALASDSGAPSDLILQRATKIESTTFAAQQHSSGGPYRQKMRSLYLNLKEKTNPGLREAIVSGDLKPETFCVMSVQDMASEERKREDAKIEENNLWKAKGAGEAGAETDAFKCFRCGERKTRYTQAQTRSADEPMTTFVTCVNCGNRWKFS